MIPKNRLRRNTLLFLLILCGTAAFSQNTDSTKVVVSGSVSVTNNGISLVPAFSLDKPAIIFDVAIRKNRFSFEPQLAFSIKDATPWYMVFWLRYKVIETPRFNMRTGFHPGFLFDASKANGVNEERITASRFFVGELAPNYKIAKDISIGIYFQHSRGFSSLLRQSNFLGLNANFSNICLGRDFFIRATPQAYYLKNDDKEGIYLTSAITLAKRGFPLSVSSLLNQKIKSDIPSNDFIWNLTLTYSY